MSGFDKAWLALREPADQAARHPGLVEVLARTLSALPDPRVLDIGCGTGSTWRSLARQMPGTTAWQLLDYDPVLLEEAERQIGSNPAVTFHRHDLNEVGTLPLTGTTMVTASALFDLCSEAFCEALTDRLVEAGCGLYAALNVDGVVSWSIPHPLDAQIVDLFNQHQRTDKGFGPALGPDASGCLARLFDAHGYHVTFEPSPWHLDQASSALQMELLKGFRQPLLEVSDVPQATIDAWLAFRLAAIHEPESSCLVGHTDVLALPT